jgi:hypothetical protein
MIIATFLQVLMKMLPSEESDPSPDAKIEFITGLDEVRETTIETNENKPVKYPMKLIPNSPKAREPIKTMNCALGSMPALWLRIRLV